MPYDLFISYARSDNAQGRITELKAQIEADHRRFVGAGGPDLHVFFDTVEISGAYNWRYCMLDAILDSRLLLICLSPAYLESDYCAWELNEYLKHEAARSLLGDGVAPVYLVEIPGWTDKDYDQRAAKWVAELRRRRHFDLRSWSSRGPAALNDVAVLVRMDELNRQIHDRLTRIRTVLEAKGNVDRRNEHFKGRAAELRWLRESLGLGKLGVLTAVHGLGGMGKTALALEYAYAFAHEYPAGRWQVRCEGRDDLRAAVASLAGARDLEFEFTDEEKNDLDLEFERVLRELKKRADASPAGRVLMILDNVDRPTLLEPAQTARLARDDWLHLVATTRLGEDELFGKENDRAFLPVDELSEAAAVELIESHQPGAKFRDAAERAAAEDIVRLVGRFTLAVEAAAVFLGQFSGDETCAGFRDRLKRKGLTGLDQAASATAERVRLSEKSLIATLLPTLERLGEPERLALDCAALLPADHVPLPWLRAVTATRFPDLGHDAEPGHPDPWQSVVRRLFSLRLLQPTGVCDDQRNALVVRMHRLVRGCVTGENQPKGSILGRCVSAVMGLFGDARRIDAAALEKGVLTHIKARAGSLWDSSVGHDRRWELGPLAACAWLWLERESADGADLANQAAGPLEELGKFAEAEPLYRRALLIDERCHGPKHPTVGRDLINLAELLRATNRVAEAEPLCRRAGDQRAKLRTGPPRGCPRADQPCGATASHQPAGRGRAALPPGAGNQREKPRSGTPGCRPRLDRPDGATAGHQPAGRGRAALPPGAGDQRATPRVGPPQRRPRPQQPGRITAGHQPARRGRTALPPGAGDQRAQPPGGPPRCHPRRHQPGGAATGHQPAGRGRAVLPAGSDDHRATVWPRPRRGGACPRPPGAPAPGHQPVGRGRAAPSPGAGDPRAPATAPTTPTSPPA